MCINTILISIADEQVLNHITFAGMSTSVWAQTYINVTESMFKASDMHVVIWCGNRKHFSVWRNKVRVCSYLMQFNNMTLKDARPPEYQTHVMKQHF